MKPIIGITAGFSSDDIGGLTHLGTKEQQWSYLATDYTLAVERAGGIPVLLPTYEDAENALGTLEALDGLLLSGGADLSPLLYGEDFDSRCGRIENRRDAWEFALAVAALSISDLPLLGICRGCQLLNIAAGGTLYQDIGDNGREHFLLNVAHDSCAHAAIIAPDTRLAKVFAQQEAPINSYHHQAIKDLGKSFIINARARDGIVEGIELPGERFVLGVQWHPEMLPSHPQHQSIFKAFVRACGTEAGTEKTM